MRLHTFFSTDVVRWAARARGALFRSDPLAPKPALANCTGGERCDVVGQPLQLLQNGCGIAVIKEGNP